MQGTGTPKVYWNRCEKNVVEEQVGDKIWRPTVSVR